ncbi:hypothetical protein BX666DRAFT_1861409 [Dichotomocladium elegans]|nr:hypothetical protein BX666DRAFT_1861409 [Dichotomocladium elegans]
MSLATSGPLPLPLPPPAPANKYRTCFGKIWCCTCCVCFPRWLRSLCCVLFLVVIAMAIVVGVLAAIFRVPTVSFNGIQGEPQLVVNGAIANFFFNLNITVDNPNVESITFDSVVATAYYPGHPLPSIGGGQLNNVYIARYALTQITFPFTLSLNSKDNSTQTILLDLMDKCGLTGGVAGGVKINYSVVPTVNVIGIKVSPTITNSASLPCNSNVSLIIRSEGGCLCMCVCGRGIHSIPEKRLYTRVKGCVASPLS